MLYSVSHQLTCRSLNSLNRPACLSARRFAKFNVGLPWSSRIRRASWCMWALPDCRLCEQNKSTCICNHASSFCRHENCMRLKSPLCLQGLDSLPRSVTHQGNSSYSSHFLQTLKVQILLKWVIVPFFLTAGYCNSIGTACNTRPW